MVVISLCDAYKDSANCRLEAQYALQRRKPLVFVKLQVGGLSHLAFRFTIR